MRSLLFVLFAVVSCGGGGGGGGNEQRQETGSTPTLTYDSELTAPERQALSASTTAMQTLAIDGTRIKRFPEIFGGTQAADVVRYFEERVHYALSADTDIESRLVVQPAALVGPADKAELLAVNPSSFLWFNAKNNEPAITQFEVNNALVSIDSSRIGVMQFGPTFGSRDLIEQVTTLVHEARHSDCTGGVLASDLQRVKNQQLPLNHPCGHTHEICPSGPFVGLFACDAHPWGAYAIDAVYSAAIAATCITCTEAQRSVAEISATDSVSRLLYSPEDLLNGRFGSPDMSSSNQVR